jgi:hypothetical protein
MRCCAFLAEATQLSAHMEELKARIKKRRNRGKTPSCDGQFLTLSTLIRPQLHGG